jgi:hypothetical protein
MTSGCVPFGGTPGGGPLRYPASAGMRWVSYSPYRRSLDVRNDLELTWPSAHIRELGDDFLLVASRSSGD